MRENLGDDIDSLVCEICDAPTDSSQSGTESLDEALGQASDARPPKLLLSIASHLHERRVFAFSPGLWKARNVECCIIRSRGRDELGTRSGMSNVRIELLI